tara:strand:- start:3 stop:695 length:693 start_codon:yes stop_codon:yes gene_type:complete
MASKLTNWINSKLKAKGMSSKEAQKSAGKYSSIAAAKKAGSLYYTDKKGRVMIAAYAEDLKAPKKPVKRPEVKVKKTENVSNKEVEKAIAKAKSKIKIAESEASVRAAEKAFAEADRKLDIFNKTTVLNETARKFKEEKVKLKNELKEKLKEPKVSVTIIKASPGPLKRKPTDEERVKNEQLRQRNSKEVEAADRYRQPGQGSGRGLRGTRPEGYKKGGLIDMRKTGLFK